MYNFVDILYNYMSKILITGFPHCGTTILKCIMGHIVDVDEIIDETCQIEQSTSKPYILGKWPFTLEHFFTSDYYKEYTIIFIIRNPIYVYSSLNKRMNYDIDEDHNLDNYIKTAKLFIQLQQANLPNVYLIKYEDMFDNNYYNLKQILNNIGLIYDDGIFDNTRYTNLSHSHITIQDVHMQNGMPPNVLHELYRTWQVNKPFVINNTCDKIDITAQQKDRILNNPDILTIYPEIKTMLT